MVKENAKLSKRGKGWQELDSLRNNNAQRWWRQMLTTLENNNEEVKRILQKVEKARWCDSQLIMRRCEEAEQDFEEGDQIETHAAKEETRDDSISRTKGKLRRQEIALQSAKEDVISRTERNGSSRVKRDKSAQEKKHTKICMKHSAEEKQKLLQ